MSGTDNGESTNPAPSNASQSDPTTANERAVFVAQPRTYLDPSQTVPVARPFNPLEREQMEALVRITLSPHPIPIPVLTYVLIADIYIQTRGPFERS